MEEIRRPNKLTLKWPRTQTLFDSHELIFIHLNWKFSEADIICKKKLIAFQKTLCKTNKK